MNAEDPVVSEPSGLPPRQATEIVHLADGSATASLDPSALRKDGPG